ncbi:50S ribosomal protein L25 [Candidatus Woesebacteria bacterium]|nr:50S ribosomal protein L25 [Candidatus Woesebacteria bacterium]
MATQILSAEKREVSGRKVKKLRRDGILPANIYGKKIESLSVQVPIGDFRKVFKEVGETGLVELKVAGKAYPVLVHNVQLDPTTDEFLHADFLHVNLKEKVTATVPVEFTGEAPAEKTGEGVVVHQLSEVEVEALPTDLPEKIVVDISSLEKVDDAIKVSEFSVDRKKVEIKEEDTERIVVSVAPPAKEEEVAPPSVEEGAEGEAAEGEEAAPSEGDEAQPKAGEVKEGEAKAAEGEAKPDGGKPEGKQEAKLEEKPREQKKE